MSNVDGIEPKFENVARIPIVLHIGRSGKKTHLSYADIDRCTDTGEICFVPYASMCGSAKWSVRSGRSGETMMQHTGKAHITCKKCGVKDVELNPQGYDVDHLRTYHEVYSDVMINNIVNTLNEDDKKVAMLILQKYHAYHHVGGVPPRIMIDGEPIRLRSTLTKNATSMLNIALAIYGGKKVEIDVWAPCESKHVTKTIKRGE